MRIRNPKSKIRNNPETRTSKPRSRSVARVLGVVFSSFGFVSDFGFLISATAVVFLPAAVLAAPDSIPPLAPPRGEIAPTFWEQHGLWVVIGGVGLAALGAGLIWLLRRPKRPVVVPPEVQARQTLEPLRQRPEDGVVLSQVSQVLRHYVAAAFALPEGELTTAEFCRALDGNEQLGAELSRAVGDFLRQCDQRKFAPAPLAAPPAARTPPLRAVSQVLELIDAAEARRAAVAPGQGA
jgi:hypothetical protein